MKPNENVTEEGHLADHLAVLRRRWRTILLTFLAFVGVTALANSRLPLVYEARVRLMIGAPGGGSLLSERGSPMEGYLLERRSFETQLEVMHSEPVATLAAERLGWLEPGSDETTRWPKIAAVQSAVSVRHLRDTRIVVLSARSNSPAGARALADAVAGAYIDYARDQGDRARTRSVAWLTEELDALRAKLRESEERLVDYLAREDLDIAAEVESGPVLGDEKQRAELAAAEVALSQLLGRYRGRHPRVLEARAHVDALRQRLVGALERHSVSQRSLIQYRLLKRDADLDHELYDVLLKKLKETDVTEGIGGADIRVLESARLPGAPVAPNTQRNLAVACVLGLCFALALALAVEYFDRSVVSPEDVARALAQPTLSVVTSFAGEPVAGRLAAEIPGSPESETFRTLRTNVRFSHVDLARRVVLVTSTGPAEGKSTVLANLGASLAQSGRRTLMIDTDLRRPTLHRVFRLERTAGLADALAGEASLAESVRSTHIEGLDLIPSGTVPPNPAELIESARLQELLGSLREQYEYVLLDSPPAGGLVDASLLAGLADGVLFVVEPRRYDSRLLRSTVRQLERAGGRLYGVVLNKAPSEGSGALYRYYRYGRESADGEVEATGAA